MAVFRSELNWSTYQDKQMKALESIGRTLENTDKRLDNSFNRFESILTFMARASEVNARNISAMTKEWTNSSVEFTHSINDVIKSNEKFISSTGNAGRGLDELDKKSRQAGDTLVSNFGTLAKRIFDKLGGLEGIGRKADNFSENSNQMIKLSGMRGNDVREFRSEIMSIVSELNRTTGSLYSAAESYQLMISTSQNITSDLDAIEEMARPLLLTSETLDVNINTVADLMNRFYVRYNFSSTSMEATLDAIRGNTAGNSASAASTLEAIEKLDGVINYWAKGDESKIEAGMASTSTIVSWLESMEMGSLKDDVIQALYDISAGNVSSELVGILNAAGMDVVQSQKMLDENYAENSLVLAQKYVEGLLSYSGAGNLNIMGQFARGAVAEGAHLDYDTTLALQNLMNGNYTTIEEFIKSQENKEPETMEDLAEDKYVSMGDKINHWLELIYEKVAKLQELNPLGFGLSDVASLVYLTRGLGGSSGGNLLGSTGNAMVRGTGLSGALASGGYNMLGGAANATSVSGAQAAALGGLGVAGVAAGVGMGAYGISTGINDIKQGDTGYGVANIAGGAAALGGAGALTAGLLGAGAAAGPIGWALLAVGGVALLTTSIVKAANKIGSAEAVEKAYKEAGDSIVNSSKENENVLLQIKSNLELGKDLEDQRNTLINSGILAESDLQLARDANEEGLKKLTEAYLKATDQMSTDALDIMDKYERNDVDYAKSLHGNLEEKLQEWNDNGELIVGSDKAEATEALLYRLYSSLKDRVSGGETLDKDTQKLYGSMIKVFESERGSKFKDEEGNITTKGFNKIIDAGAWNTIFQNSSFTPEELISATNMMAVKNSTGKSAVEEITEGLGHYYGADNVKYVADSISKLNAWRSNGLGSVEDAQKILDDLKDKGYNSELYPEIAAAAEAWGLSGYAEGTNYIDRDQIALLHEGEAVVPKKYNPTANNIRELRQVIGYMQDSQSDENRENQEYFIEFIEELRDIKDFLKSWKDYNMKQDRLNINKSRNGLSSSFVTRYLNMT